MTEDQDAPSWSQRDGREPQRDHRGTNERARRLRREQTPTEARLWKGLRLLNREGFHFRRQPAIGPRVFDFSDLSRRLLIEVNGGVHERIPEVAARDKEKAAWADANGFRLHRVTNDQVWGLLDDVISAIRQLVSDPHPLPPPRKGEGESEGLP